MNIPINMIQIIKNIRDLRAQVSLWRKSDQKIALVPTMGALHNGHLSLVRLARQHADRVIVSIFVNPTQFNEASDFDHYPRDEQKDISLLKEEGADIIFMPTVDVMYPQPFLTTVTVSQVTEDMEGSFRDKHYDGVATVVTKLFLQCLPDIAILGEKDFQQVCVIKNMVRNLDIPVEVIGAPIIRDEGGLALSSRNVFLSAEGLEKARHLNKVLFQLATDLENKTLTFQDVENVGTQLLKDVQLSDIDYLELRTADLLEKVTEKNKHKNLRLLAVVRVDNIRLLDNVAVAGLS